MNFLAWLRSYAHWDTVAWLSLIGVGVVLELLGVFGKHFTTFTDLVRSTVPLWVRAAILGMLCYHFLIQK